MIALGVVSIPSLCYSNLMGYFRVCFIGGFLFFSSFRAESGSNKSNSACLTNEKAELCSNYIRTFYSYYDPYYKLGKKLMLSGIILIVGCDVAAGLVPSLRGYWRRTGICKHEGSIYCDFPLLFVQLSCVTGMLCLFLGTLKILSCCSCLEGMDLFIESLD